MLTMVSDWLMIGIRPFHTPRTLIATRCNDVTMHHQTSRRQEASSTGYSYCTHGIERVSA